uniref:Uncharacterized protein n=1 Tax=Myripristis murdjan TaxID=586833 RepID=A0A668A723_9TELE
MTWSSSGVHTRASSIHCLLSEDQFLCSSCLDVFTDPVSTPCGRNFCKTCITQHWDDNAPYQCPVCKEVFDQREVPCDVCTGTKLKALKSCLPHQRITGLKTHQMCNKHDAPLQLFCKTDQMCVCLFCTSDHKSHDIVPLKEEYEGKKAELGKTEAEIQQMIQKRQVKIQEIKRSVELSREDAEREIADSLRVFTALMQSVERGQAELIDMIEKKQKTTEKQAEGFIKELQQEISVLMRRSSEVEQLSHTEDHLHLLQSFPSLSAPPHTKNWTEVRAHRSSYVGSVRRAVAQLEETLSNEMKKLLEAELKRVQQFEVEVTLDPDTAHPKLILSDDEKQVKHGDVRKNLPDNPERFSRCTCVLGKQSFSSGRFYYKVEVRGKTEWDLGVARESINRKGDIALCPEDGYWTIYLRNGNEYQAAANSDVRLSLKSQPQKVGVFVDYEEGLVSFYDVDAAALIYSYSGCSFTEKLHPFFSLCFNDRGKNSAPLIICPVKHTN